MNSNKLISNSHTFCYTEYLVLNHYFDGFQWWPLCCALVRVLNDIHFNTDSGKVLVLVLVLDLIQHNPSTDLKTGQDFLAQC